MFWPDNNRIPKIFTKESKVEADLRISYTSNSKDSKYLLELPGYLGDHTDSMTGFKYLRYYLGKMFQLLSGLAIYKCWFKNADGTRGVIGGPPKFFSEIKLSYQVNVKISLSYQYKLFNSGYQVNLSDSNGIQTRNLVCKRTLNHLAKLNPDALMLHVKT